MNSTPHAPCIGCPAALDKGQTAYIASALVEPGDEPTKLIAEQAIELTVIGNESSASVRNPAIVEEASTCRSETPEIKVLVLWGLLDKCLQTPLLSSPLLRHGLEAAGVGGHAHAQIEKCFLCSE